LLYPSKDGYECKIIDLGVSEIVTKDNYSRKIRSRLGHPNKMRDVPEHKCATWEVNEKVDVWNLFDIIYSLPYHGRVYEDLPLWFLFLFPQDRRSLYNFKNEEKE